MWIFGFKHMHWKTTFLAPEEDDLHGELLNPKSCVAGTTEQANLVEWMLTVRWLPKDRQPTPRLEQNLSRRPRTARRPPKDGRPTQTEARQRRIDSARRFDDAN
jgi:hypothetical protein